MALTATVYRLGVTLSDVDRSVYEKLEFRIARHPSESGRYFWLRVLAYCLSYEEGMVFSRGGLSDPEEPPLSVHDATGVLRVWVEIGAPSADRLHRAAKAAPRVVLYSATERSLLEREASSRRIHALADIEVNLFDPAFLEGLEKHLEKHLELELVRNQSTLYLTLPKGTLEGTVSEIRLGAPA
jgi:uncharacterized protein YaeQ